MLNVSLMPFRRFVDEEMVIVMRQMDSPSQILDYLYLGSEWNASNLEELQQNKYVSHDETSDDYCKSCDLI